ncbi:uncharacterized protein EDB93DRAFT_1099874 [Suillus bovinus]|uniref:uncharacterized protein n=1 Tax=Suillus bovinus TaxID=48563 RepID=UPI001B87CB32|nr:uncharacterized protein EDB93DRAFT_1099874 [Suillus bovinus]KAG2159524.1 hypothetical protein EDB93DRAFT_1099874 [Suillus bovinus]
MSLFFLLTLPHSVVLSKNDTATWDHIKTGKHIMLGCVGHPVALQKIVRDCFGLKSAALAVEAMDIDECKSDNDEQWMDGGIEEEEEVGEEGEEGEEDSEGDKEGDREEFDDEYDDDLSF